MSGTRLCCVALALLTVGILIGKGWSPTALPELLSSGVGLALALGSEAGFESQIEMMLESGQTLVKRAQQAWQRLSFGWKMAIVCGLRVFGPFFCLLLIALLKALPGLRSPGKNSNLGDSRC